LYARPKTGAIFCRSPRALKALDRGKLAEPLVVHEQIGTDDIVEITQDTRQKIIVIEIEQAQRIHRRRIKIEIERDEADRRRPKISGKGLDRFAHRAEHQLRRPQSPLESRSIHRIVPGAKEIRHVPNVADRR
jgi:hypothetical protein